MPFIVKCKSCGYVLYRGKELRDLSIIIRQFDARCPCCLSDLRSSVSEYVVIVRPVRK